MSTGCVNEVSSMVCTGSVGNGLCLPSLICVSKPLFAPCISGTLMPSDFACDLVCIRYLFGFGCLILFVLLIQ